MVVGYVCWLLAFFGFIVVWEVLLVSHVPGGDEWAGINVRLFTIICHVPNKLRRTCAWHIAMVALKMIEDSDLSTV